MATQDQVSLEGKTLEDLTDPELTQLMHRLSEEALPKRAEESGDYPVRFDHCFKRIAYDAAAGAKWDEVVGRPFYEHAGQDLKREATQVLQNMLLSPRVARAYNNQSLAYRS
jgi:hypothetical protein